MKAFCLTVFGFIFLISCNKDGSVFPVSGVIIHNQNSQFSLNNDFNNSAQSFALITVSQKIGEKSSNVIYEKRVDSVDSFPLKFTLNPKETVDESGSYYITAKVFARKSNVLFVGDLVSQHKYELNQNSDFLEIEVFGLENCNDEIADSFCTNRDKQCLNCPEVNGKNFEGPPRPLPCTGGEGCGYSGSVSFSEDTQDASFHPANSDAIAMLLYSQNEAGINLFSEENEANPIEFNFVNECKEIQHQKSGTVYRDGRYSWDVVW